MAVPHHHLEIHGSTDDAGRNVLVLSGDVDLQTAPELRERIEQAGVDGTTVVIDLRDVRFMDSPGMGTVIHCHRLLEERGSALVARDPQGPVRELFEVVRLGSIIE